MKKTLLSTIWIFALPLCSFAQPDASIQWQNTIGGSNNDIANQIKKTSDGGYIIGGYSNSNISGDKTENSNGGNDFWMVKTDASGNISWQNTIGGSGDDFLTSLQQTSDGGYIIGGYSSSNISGDKTENSNGVEDYWIVKTNSLGAIQWQNTIGGNSADVCTAISQTSDGGYIIGGYSISSLSGDKTENNNGWYDYWVVKADASGNIVWQNTIGGNDYDKVESIEQTADGGYIIGGISYSGLSGDKTENAVGDYDCWIIKLNSTGSILWQNTIGGTGYDSPSAIKELSGGGYILGASSRSNISGDKTENSNGEMDYWILLLNTSGAITWQNTIGGDTTDFLTDIKQTSDGGFILGGRSASNVSGDKTEANKGYSDDYWIVKTNLSGAVLWENTIGGVNVDNLASIAIANDGGYVCAGISLSGIGADKSEATIGIGTSDFWIVKHFPQPCSAVITASGSTSICVGDSIGLNANIGFGSLTFQWKKNGTNITGATSFQYYATTSGSYTVTVTNSTGCSATSTATVVNAVTPPSTAITISGSLVLCTGQFVTMQVTQTAGAFYQWYKNNVAISGQTLSSHSASTIGTYKVSVIKDGCVIYSANQVVTQTGNPPPISVVTCDNPNFACSGITATLQATSGATSYKWRLDGALISGATSSTYIANTTGSYWAEVYDVQGCMKNSNAYQVVGGTHAVTISSSASYPTCIANEYISLEAKPPGTDITAYVWKLNGAPIQGATSRYYSVFVTLATAPSYGGSYTVDAINECGTYTSAPFVVSFLQPPVPVVSTSGVNYFCGTGSVTLNSTLHPGCTYQWGRNGYGPLSGATATSYSANLAGAYYVTVTDANGCSRSSEYFNVYASGFAPSISPSVVNHACLLQTLTALPSSGYTYQWYRSGTIIPGATSSTYNATQVNNYYYSCIITNAACGTGTATTNSFNLSTSVTTPAITGSSSACNGNIINLGLSPYGIGWSYQWQINGTNISGATNGTYASTQAGNYTCFITQACGSTTTNPFAISFNSVPTASINANGSTNLCNGASVTLNANTGTGITYQWSRNGTTISGATINSYVTNVGGTYRCIVTNISGCSATSNFINVFTGAGATAAVTPSGTVSFCAGLSLTLTANTGTGITYQWYKNGIAQAGATSSSYLIGNAGTYYVVETSSCGTATSNSVVVNQINNPNPVVTYTTPTTFCSPGNVLFTANTFTGVTYQWQKNSVDIAGATAQTYLATTNGKYRVKETANGCTKQGTDLQVSTATSVTATIAANGPVTFCTGGSVVLSVSNAIPGYSYQWKNNGVNIAGATTSSYTATAAGTYTCTVSASCGSATSNSIVVSTGGIVALVNPSGTVNICNGATVSFSANTGSGYAYQWKKNGTNISGATSANYSATTAGSYTVAITSPCGNATSAATTVNITALTANITPTGTTTICNGSAATFTANTGYNYTYQWYRAGLAIAGATATTHANSTAGNYTVIITQGGVCSATSNIAILAVTNNPNPSVTAGGPTTFCVGQSVTLTANTFAGVTYQWIKGSTNIAGATNQSYTATTAGQYSVKETANGCTKQLGVPIVVTVNCKLGNEVIGVNGDEGIKVFPNPTSGILKLGAGSLKSERVGVSVYDVLGKEVFVTRFKNTEETNVHEMDLTTLKSGVYFMQVTTLTEKKTLKVVKQ